MKPILRFIVVLPQILTLIFGLAATILAAGTIYMMRKRDTPISK